MLGIFLNDWRYCFPKILKPPNYLKADLSTITIMSVNDKIMNTWLISIRLPSILMSYYSYCCDSSLVCRYNIKIITHSFGMLKYTHSVSHNSFWMYLIIWVLCRNINQLICIFRLSVLRSLGNIRETSSRSTMQSQKMACSKVNNFH